MVFSPIDIVICLLFSVTTGLYTQLPWSFAVANRVLWFLIAYGSRLTPSMTSFKSLSAIK